MRFAPAAAAARATAAVPSTFTARSRAGSAIERCTSTCAARCTTASGANSARNAPKSASRGSSSKPSRFSIPSLTPRRAAWSALLYVAYTVNVGGDFMSGRFFAMPFLLALRNPAGRIVVAMCYDRHFEGVIWSLSKEGAEIIFSPAVTFGAKSRRMWRLEFAVDSARHDVFIGGSNRKGAEPPWNQPYFGDTHFVGPHGEATNLSHHPNLVIADLDLGELTAPHAAGWDLERDARPTIYTPRD